MFRSGVRGGSRGRRTRSVPECDIAESGIINVVTIGAIKLDFQLCDAGQVNVEIHRVDSALYRSLIQKLAVAVNGDFGRVVIGTVFIPLVEAAGQGQILPVELVDPVTAIGVYVKLPVVE